MHAPLISVLSLTLTELTEKNIFATMVPTYLNPPKKISNSKEEHQKQSPHFSESDLDPYFVFTEIKLTVPQYLCTSSEMEFLDITVP
jgi:hypothetical protein